METSIIPAHGSDSLETPTSLRALASVYQPYTTPGEMKFGAVFARLKAGAPNDTALVVSPGALKLLVSDEQDVIDQADATTGPKVATLTPSNPANSTHELTATGDDLAELFDADSAAALEDALITSRKPRVSLETTVDRIAEAAKAANKHVLIIVNRENATIKVVQDSQGNIATKYAAIVAEKGSEGCFATIDGTAPSAGSAATVYLN